MQFDGAVLIDTKMSTDGMEKGFERIKSDVGGVADAAQKAGNKIEVAFSEINVSRQVEKAVSEVQTLEHKLESILAERKIALSDNDDKAAEKLDAQRVRTYDQLSNARRRLVQVVETAAAKEAAAEEKAAARAAKAAKKAAEAKEKAQAKQINSLMKPVRRFGSRMSEIVTGALFFNLISRGLQEMTQYFGSALMANDAFSSSLARLKGAFLTAFQPIYEFVLPALITLMNVLTSVMQAIGQFFAAISGKSYKQMQQNAEALQDQANGIGSVGSAAKKAKRDIASFDKLNKLSFGDTSAGSGGVGSSGVSAEFADTETIENLDHILYLVGAIAAALLTWKIASAFTDSLSSTAGLALSVGGALLYGFNWADAFANGIDWNNLSGMLLGLAAGVGGLALVFGTTGAAVGLLVGGIGLVVLGIKDWIENGELGTEACIALVAGIMAIGGAISLFTGSWIPLAIAAVVGFVVAAATNGDKMKEGLQKLDDWLTGIFTKDWRETFGPVLGSILNGFFEEASKLWKDVKGIFEALIDFISGVFAGDWEQAFDALKRIASGVFSLLEDIMMAPFDALTYMIYHIAQNALPEVFKEGVNGVISIVNKLINWLNKTLSFEIDPIEIAGQTIFDGGSLKLVNIPKIPYLAKGAVIPPNAPFLAALGDQKRGINIESPLSTIEDALDNVLHRRGSVSDQRVVDLLQDILSAVLGIEVGDDVIGRAVERYNAKMFTVRGR